MSSKVKINPLYPNDSDKVKEIKANVKKTYGLDEDWGDVGYDKSDDKINPPHYKQTCGLDLEAIDIMKTILTTDQFVGYCAGNALKYRLRAGKKYESMDCVRAKYKCLPEKIYDEIETDIKKAMWYEDKIK